MSKTKNAKQLIQHAGNGITSLSRVLSPGQYRPKEAGKIWGFPPLLLLPVVAAGCFAISYFIPMGIQYGNPFSMSFPMQAGQMAIGLFLSPITLFAIFCGWRLEKSIEKNHLDYLNLDQNWANLGLPVMVSGLFLVMLYEAFLSYRFFQDGFSFLNIIHSFGNMMFLAAWLSFFVAVASMRKGAGIGKMIAGFFSFHGILFARSFIPTFGVLDFVANNLLKPDYLSASWMTVMASVVKALLCMGVVGVFWILLQEKLKSQLASNQKEALPPIPIQPEPIIPPIPGVPEAPEVQEESVNTGRDEGLDPGYKSIT